MDRWEYTYHWQPVGGFFTGADEKTAAAKPLLELNHLGENGWELVAVVPLSTTDGLTMSVVHWFKRRKPDQANDESPSRPADAR